MKLHLPKRLFTALVSSLVMAAPMAITLASGALVFATGSAMGADQQLTENVTWDATNTTTASEDGTIQVGGEDANRDITLTIIEGANIEANWMLLRRGGNVNMTGGQVTLNKLHIHNHNKGGATEVFTLSGGVLEVNAANNFTATGTGDRTPVTIGHWGNGGGKLVVSGGTLQVHNGSIYMGHDSHATLQITAGEANVAGLYYNKDADTGSRLELSGGRLNIGSEGIRNTRTEATSSRVVSLTGGTLGALDNWTLSGVTTTIGTIKIDTDKWDAATGATAVGENIGMNISLLGNITAAEGGIAITLAGSGSLTINRTLAGTITTSDSAKVILASNSDWKDFGATYVNANGESSASGFVNTLQVAQAGSTFANSKIYIGDTAYTVTDGIADVLSMSKVFYINDAQKYDASAAEDATSFLVRETGIFDLTGATANSVPIINHGQVELTSTGFLDQITNKSTGIVYLNEDEGQQLLKLTGSFEGKTLNTTVDGNVVTSSGGNFNGYLTVLSGTTLKANTVDALGSHDKAITIQKGATLDVNGKSSYNKLILEGGAILANDSENRTGGNSSVLDHRQLDVITLNGDAEIRGKGTFGMVGNSWNVSNLYLNNHTFTKTGTGEFLLVNTNIAAGTILVREGTMTAKSHSNNTVDITAAHVQVESSGTFYQTGSDEQLGSLTLNGGTVKTDANKLTVSGHALLNSGTINANLIVNNATIESAASVSSGKTLTFAENSQLFISEKQVTQSGFVASGLTGTLITGAGTVTLGAGMTASFAGASVSLSQAAGALTFTTTTKGTTYVVVTGDTQNATDTVAATSGFTGYYVQEQGILNLTVAEGTLSNANAANAITTTRGAGVITVNSEISINQRNISTVFDGDIQINAGGTLKLGSDSSTTQRDNGTANLAGGVILNGGQLWFHGKTMNLDKLTSINDASVVRVYDMAVNDRLISVGEMDLQEDLMLLTRPDGSDVGWKYTMNVGVLKGSGTLSTHSYERSDLTVNDVTNYTGQINLGNNSTLKLGAGSGTLKVGVNHANAQVQALDGWTGTVFLSGGADGLNVKNLESAANSASKLRFNGLTGWLDNTMNVDIILQNSTGTGDNTALKLNNGSSEAKNTANFAKSVSGSGDMKYMWTGGTIGYITSHVFSGDTSSWDGWFISGANAGKKVEAVFTAGGNVFDAAGNGGVKDERTSGYHLNVTIDAANDNVTSFNGSIINANQLTVNSDTNFNQNVNTASTILASGVEITLGQKLNETSSNKTTYSLGTLTAAANGNTINLNNGATLEALTKGNGSGTITLTGSGIYKLESNSTTSNVSGLTDATWSGTVVVADTSQRNDKGEVFQYSSGYNSLYNSSSFLQITNAKGYLQGELTANLKLVNGENGFAMQLANGSSGSSYNATFSGSISGSGHIVYVWSTYSGTNSTTHIFSNDTSDWKGQFIRDITNYNATNAYGKVTNVKFTYGGHVFSSADDSNGGVVDMDNSGRLNVTIESGSPTYFNGKLENIATVTVNSETDFNKFVTATTITLKQDATFSGEVTANTLSVAAGKSITLNGGTAEDQMLHSVGTFTGGTNSNLKLGDYTTLSFASGTETEQKVNTVGTLTTGTGASLVLGDYATLELGTMTETAASSGNSSTTPILDLIISGGTESELRLNLDSAGLDSQNGWNYNNTVRLSTLREGEKMVDTVRIVSGPLANRVYGATSGVYAATDLGGAALTMAEGTSLILRNSSKDDGEDFGAGKITLEGTTTLYMYGSAFKLNNDIEGKHLKVTNAGSITFAGSLNLESLTTSQDITFGGGTAQTQKLHSIGTLSATSNNVTIGEYVTLTLGGDLSTSGNVTMSENATLTLGGGLSTSGNVTMSGNATLTLSGGTIEAKRVHSANQLTAGGSNANILVGDYAELTLNDYLDLSKGFASSGLMTVGVGSTMKATNNIWMNKDYSILLKDTAKLKFGDLVTITGRQGDASLITTSAIQSTEGSDKYSTGQSTYTLSHVDVEVSATGDTTMGNKLEASALTHAGSGTLTVSNSGNTITSLAAEGGNVKLSAGMEVNSISAKSGKTVTVTDGNTIRMAGGVNIGTNEGDATMTAQTDTALLQLQADASFTIADMELANVAITTADENTKVNLSGVSATDVQLTKGEFHMLDKAQPQVGTGGSAINLVEGGPTGLDFSTSLLNGMTLGADASMVVDLGDLSGFTGMSSGKPTFSITLEGFNIGDFLSENPGIYFAADSWLGQLLVAQGASQYVKGDSLEAGAQATAGSGVSVSYNPTSVGTGTVITISGLQVPEPTTTSLSLLALSALAMRRRRK